MVISGLLRFYLILSKQQLRYPKKLVGQSSLYIQKWSCKISGIDCAQGPGSEDLYFCIKWGLKKKPEWATSTEIKKGET